MSETSSQVRTLSGWWKIAADIMMGGVALFYLWAATVGVVSLQYFRGIAVLYSLIVPLLVYRSRLRDRGESPSPLDLLFAGGGSRRCGLLDGRA